MLRRRRRREAGRRSWGEAEGAPPVGRARVRLRGAGAGARAGSRGGYDDPAAGPRISSPPPPPHCSPSSRLRTRHTGGESRRGGSGLGRERPPIGLPRRGRAGHGLSGAPGLRGEPPSAAPTRDQAPSPAPRPVTAAEGIAFPGKWGGCGLVFGATPPCPATSLLGVLLSSDDRGPPGVFSPGRFFLGCRGRFPVCGLCV